MKKIFLFFLFLFLASTISATEKVNINSASLEELKNLTGIGDVKAQAIIDARPFSSVDDLLKVKGIGEKTLEKIKEQGLACVDCESTPVIASEANQSIDEEKFISYPSGIFVNEVLASAEGSDETGEWIEIFNSNNFEVDLAGWKIKDTAGTPKTFVISENKKIAGFGFLVFARPETKITLNNDGDGVVLQNPNGEIVDSVQIPKTSKGISFARFSSGWQQTANPTPGKINNPSTNSGPDGLPKTEKSDSNSIEAMPNGWQAETLTANLSQNSNPWFLFLTAVVITIISAIILIFIKFKLNKTNVRS